MIKKLSQNMVRLQVSKGILHTQDREIYEYAYEVLIGQIINILITCSMAFLFRYYMILIFLLAYIPLRTYAGGFHASNNERCIASSSIVLCIVCVFGKYILTQNMMPLIVLSEALAVAVIFAFAPVEDRNKPLGSREKRKYRTYAYVITLIEIIIAIVLCLFKSQEVGDIIMITHIVLAGDADCRQDEELQD